MYSQNVQTVNINDEFTLNKQFTCPGSDKISPFSYLSFEEIDKSVLLGLDLHEDAVKLDGSHDDMVDDLNTEEPVVSPKASSPVTQSGIPLFLPAPNEGSSK